MLFLKYIVAGIAIFSTILFVSNIITCLTAPSEYLNKEINGKMGYEIMNKFRLILNVIMALSWAGLIVM